jgi:hypothetical protein
MKRMHASKGFSFFGYLLFIALIGVVLFLIVAMVRNISHSAQKEMIRTTAVVLAEGRMDAVQGQAFGALAAVARAPFDGELKRFSCETAVDHVRGPADLETPVAGPTPYKKVTVAVFYDNKPYARVTCVKTARE